MNLRSVDLNLLVLFDALIAERHVTRAAERLHMSQPAASGGLRKLRAIFKDELLVRTPTGMEPTPRALEIAAQVGQTIRELQRIFDTPQVFDPATSRRQITIRMSDMLALLLLPGLASQFERMAPGIAFGIMNFSPTETVTALLEERIDYAVSTDLVHPKAIGSETLFGDHLVCMTRRDEGAQQEMSQERFFALRHLKISSHPADQRFIDQALTQQGVERRIAVNLPYWLVAPDVLAQTGLGLVVPASIARRLADKRLAVHEIPFASKPVEWRLYWNRRNEQAASHAWVLQRFRDAASGLDSEGIIPA